MVKEKERERTIGEESRAGEHYKSNAVHANRVSDWRCCSAAHADTARCKESVVVFIQRELCDREYISELEITYSWQTIATIPFFNTGKFFQRRLRNINTRHFTFLAKKKSSKKLQLNFKPTFRSKFFFKQYLYTLVYIDIIEF